ncbi:MAG: type II asparaginase [Bacteroidetes bacterium]|nr:MAG: type II asparaginase [Bacteroidota bacterium]
MKHILVVLLCLGSSYWVESQNLPRIIILATGGTIAGQGVNADRAGYIPGKIPIEDLLSNIPSINKIADVRGEQVASVGSYDMTIKIWIKLARRINEIFAKNEADGIVVTHGTDTQEETAYFLNLTVKWDKPVVITGAMRPATALSADGPKNLYDAILVASDPQSKGKGVIVSFNETLYDAKNVVKMNTTHVNAFGSPNAGPIGQVYDGKVIYYSQPLQKINVDAPFDISRLDSLPKVEIVYTYVDASAIAINAFINDKTEGLIIAGVGNGSINKNILQTVETAVRKGIIVVRASRVVSGRVTQFNQVFDDMKLGTVAADNLNPQKARILLMLALTITKDKNVIQKMFLNY